MADDLRGERLLSLLRAARVLTGEERTAFLARECDDDALRTDLEQILSHEQSAEEILRSTLAGTAAPASAAAPARNHFEPGACVDHYRIVRLIGGGGMGDVYLAEQEQPVRRPVALKAIKLGMDTREVIARFETERQALALMSHPNIARVFDAGAAADGRPYFVMEYVAGALITDHCDRHRLTVNERLELFLQVCRAVQHAHDRGVIHRDLKPSNILVSTTDGVALAKVIDFGVAKAIEQRLTELTVYTEIGRALGTPAYMSPEQAATTAEDVDHRTDVYSLGVLLYELLVGELPIDWETLAKAAFDEILRRIREEDPPTPSARWTRLNLERTASLARERGTHPAALRNELRGDLDWITMKAIEKDRGRRYATAALLADDLERYLRADPVLARPPSRIYRLRKLARKNRALVLSSATIVAVLLLGLLVTTRLYLVAEDARGRAEDLVVEREAALAAKDDALAEKETALWQALRSERAALWESYVANVLAAGLHLEKDDPAEALRRLRACPAEMRGWEWHHLRLRTDLSLKAFEGHNGAIRAVAFSADGRRGASGSEDGTVRIWALGSGKGRVLFGHSAAVTAIDFSAAGDRIVSGSDDGTVRLWDALGEGVPAILDGHSDAVTAVAFDPDGDRVYSASEDRTVRRWDARAHREDRVFEGHTHGVTCLALADDGSRLISGSREEKAIRFWRLDTGESTPLSLGEVLSLALAPDNDLLALGMWDEKIVLWRIGARKVSRLEGHAEGSRVNGLDFGPEGRILASAASDDSVRVWSLSAGNAEGEMRGRTIARLAGFEEMNAVAVGPDGDALLSGGRDGTMRLWDTRTQSAVLSILGHERRVFSLDISADDALIVSGSMDSTVRVWSARSGEALAVLSGHDGFVYAAAVTGDREYIVSASEDRTLRVWKAADGTGRNWTDASVLEGHAGRVRCVDARAASPAVAVSGSDDATVRIWNLETGAARVLREHRDPVSAVAISHSGRFAASAGGTDSPGGDTRVCLWDLESASLWKALAGHEAQVRALAISTDDTLVASGAYDGRLRLWNVETGAGRALAGHQRHIYSLAFSPDGTRIASGGYDQKIRVWDTESGRCLAVLSGHESPVFAVTFTHDGRRLVSASGTFGSGRDATILLWESSLDMARRLWARKPKP